MNQRYVRQGKPWGINPEILKSFAFRINSTRKFFRTSFEKFKSH